ncbi:MAG TPA: alpha/beta hydrolase, partial [Acidimicrobiales bacterium]|nr:alpha/beta hydrolase [Acidimicrobiales bacterium]
NRELQDDGVVDAWLSLIGDMEPWPNPGRLGQYEACLAWSNDSERVKGWPTIAVSCLVLSFEHDVDSPPARAHEAANRIPGAQFVEIPDASHLGVFTHGGLVADAMLEFFDES